MVVAGIDMFEKWYSLLGQSLNNVAVSEFIGTNSLKRRTFKQPCIQIEYLDDVGVTLDVVPESQEVYMVRFTFFTLPQLAKSIYDGCLPFDVRPGDNLNNVLEKAGRPPLTRRQQRIAFEELKDMSDEQLKKFSIGQHKEPKNCESLMFRNGNFDVEFMFKLEGPLLWIMVAKAESQDDRR